MAKKSVKPEVSEVSEATSEEKQPRTRGRKKDNPDTGLFEREPGSGVWWIQYADWKGKRHREKVGSKPAARMLYAKRQTEKLQRKKLPELTPKKVLTVAEMIEKFRPEFEAKKSASDDQRYATYWAEALGSVAADEVRPSDVIAWRTKRQKVDKVAPATVNRAVAFLKRVYNLAIREGLYEASNPVSRVKQIRENNSRVRYLTDEEEGAMKALSAPDFWLKVEVAFLSGLRQMEQFTLKRSDLDFNARVITVQESKHGEKRTVPMSDRLTELFRQQLATHENEWVFPSRFKDGHFSGGGAIHGLKALAAKAGVKDLTWHDLRHTFCSRLAMAGASLATIQQLAGHKTITVTQRYSHLSPEHNRAAMELLSPRPKLAPEPEVPWTDPEALANVLRERLTTAELAHLVAELAKKKRHLRAVE